MFEMIPSKARALNAKLIHAFDEGMEGGIEEKGCSRIMDVCAIESSDGGENIYLLASEQRGLYGRGTDGSLRVVPPSVSNVSVVDEERGLVLRVSTRDLRNDKIGQYSVVARDLGVRAASDPVLALEDMAAAGDTLLGPGGVPFFGNHKADLSDNSSPTYANKFAKGAGLTFDTFGEVLQAMMKYPSATAGKAVGAMPTHLLVPTDYFGMALDICKNDLPSGLQGAKNKWLGLGIEPIVVKNWTRDMWMLVDARSKKKRPFVFQERLKITFAPSDLNGGIDSPGSAAVQRGYYDWVCHGEHGVGFLYPETAALVLKS